MALFSLGQFSAQAVPANTQQGLSQKIAAPLMNVIAGRSIAGFAVLADGKPIIEYYRRISLLEEQDTQPMLQVFANGRVRVHTPVYMKNSGDFEHWLTPAELIALVRKLSSQGIMDFDRARVHREKHTHDMKMKQKGELHYVTDSLETVVDIRLKNYQKTSQSLPQVNFSQRFSWKNLEQDARYYKNNLALQDAENGIQELDKLIHHPSMKRLK